MIKLAQLPYKRDALEPHISQRTIDFHYGQHHAGYVKNLNNLIEGSKYETMSLEEIIKNSEGSIFNNAAQVWNHTFYWHCMTPDIDTKPQSMLLDAINRDFGSFDNFKQLFIKQAATLFGSGWLWLVEDKNGKLSLMQTSNAETPITHEDLKPLLTCDVWEHAYYLDQQNQRLAYLNEFWQLINWRFVERNM
ncbi:MAG: superoxide dismutase [Bacteroidales bacterium]|jgi:Fe-Mn family superoxide dismutase|nr:superoxide dismutase [Fe] [Bacteroidales bacterium]MBQ5856604.1 superoxide dismutase [Fe] [Bacteroidales bacterium]